MTPVSVALRITQGERIRHPLTPQSRPAIEPKSVCGVKHSATQKQKAERWFVGGRLLAARLTI